MQTVIKKFDSLYCLDKTGRIRLYDVQVYFYASQHVIKSCTGLLNGNLIYKEKSVKIGKQGRTPEEQAIFEAQSDWSSKRDEGYKSMTDLSLKAQMMEKEIPENIGIGQLFELLEIKYNTDTRWYPLPMLAEKYKTHQKKIKFPMIAQPKLNGVRCLALYDADLQEVVLVSRGGKSYTVPHIKNYLMNFFLHNQNVILDGELYVHGKPLQEISGAVRKEKDCPSWVEYHIYDLVSKHSNIRRIEELHVIQNCINVHEHIVKYVHKVKSRLVHSYEEVKKVHDICVADGYEGLILRDPDAPYMVSFRDKCLLKVKEFEDAEFEIIGCKVDPNKTVGESFVFELENDINDLTFCARPMGTIKDKETWYAHRHEWMGKKCTVRFQERTKDGLPHQGHVRTDLSECLKIELVDRQDI